MENSRLFRTRFVRVASGLPITMIHRCSMGAVPAVPTGKQRVTMDLLAKFSYEDKELLKRSWTVLGKNINDTAYCIFDMIFSQSPDTKLLFPFMKFRAVGDNKRSKEMEFHGLRFMQVLESVVKAIDNPASLDPLCDNLGRVHGRLTDSRGFKPHHWGVFIECTLFHFRKVLNLDNYFNNMITLDRAIIIWRTVLRVLIKRMKVGLATDLRNRQANKDAEEGGSTSGQSSPVADPNIRNLNSDFAKKILGTNVSTRNQPNQVGRTINIRR
ncbi:unnamed protein product [Cylicocyclus nassatus]|uniref:Globin domain-containing protein n=1 Tax=Cylicocyclus nassatus TaxID=53992 RepID=A0AA36H4U6_CYLNA|nr:unnamed protein product [Cylicocyclus nassatus]